MNKVVSRMNQNLKLFTKVIDGSLFAKTLMELLFPKIYDELKKAKIS